MKLKRKKYISLKYLFKQEVQFRKTNSYPTRHSIQEKPTRAQRKYNKDLLKQRQHREQQLADASN